MCAKCKCKCTPVKRDASCKCGCKTCKGAAPTYTKSDKDMKPKDLKKIKKTTARGKNPPI